MSTAERRNILLTSTFAGALLWCWAIAHPASAEEVAPKAGLSGRCGVVSPRFEPVPRRGATAGLDRASAPGGARVHWLVAEPCLRTTGAYNI